MTELAGTQHNEKDCEIVYIEEKAPEPWIQRESFYNKDLPFPEDGDERLSDAKHIGSFMVPSPLMRLKTPSSMSSFTSDRTEDGRMSPAPSLDRSIKSERGDSDSGLAISKSGLGSVESLPHLYGLFADSNASIKDVSLDKDTQAIEITPIESTDVELQVESSDNEHEYLSSGHVGIVDEKLGLAALIEPELSATKQGISIEELQHLNNQGHDLSPGIHFKSTEQGIKASKSNIDIQNQLSSSNTSATNGSQVKLSTSQNTFKDSSTADAGNLTKEYLNTTPMAAGLGVTGSSAIAPLAAAGAAGVFLGELSEHKTLSTSENENLIADQSKSFISKEKESSSVDSLKNEKKYSGIENATSIPRKDQMSTEDDVYNSVGYARDYERSLDSEEYSLDGHIGKKQEYNVEDNESIGIGNGTFDEGKLHRENSHSDGYTIKYDQQENNRDPDEEISHLFPLSSAGEEKITGSKLSGQDSDEMGGAISNEHIRKDTSHQITDENSINVSNNLTAEEYFKPELILSTSLNESSKVSHDGTDGQILNSSNGKGFEEGNIALNADPDDLLKASTIENSSDDNDKIDEMMIQNHDSESNLISVKEAEVESRKLEALYSSNTGMATAMGAGAVPSVIGNLTEIAGTSEITEMTASSRIRHDNNNFVSDNTDVSQVQSTDSDNAKAIHGFQIAPNHQESENIQLENVITGNQLLPTDLNNSVEKEDLNTLKNEGAEKDINLIPSTKLENYRELPRDIDEVHFGTIIHDSDIDKDGNIISEHNPKPFNTKELNYMLFAYDSMLNSEMNEIAEHLAAKDVKSDNYAKPWFESIFSGPEFSPALSDEASRIYADRGPAGLVEIALNLMKINSDELLALNSRNEVLTKLTSDMNLDEPYLNILGSHRIEAEPLSSIRDNYANEVERDDESGYDSKLNILVAKYRNAEELLAQLSKIIKEMNDDITELTRENNSKSSRIKFLEDELRKKIKN